MNKLIIFPYNGNGLEALCCIQEQFEFIGFIDDTPSKLGKQPQGFEVFDRSALERFPDALVLAVPGSPTSYTYRDKIINELNIPASRFAQVIHPAANISKLAKIGHNVLIMAGVVLTANCIIRDHVCILPNSVVHHDSEIGAYTLIGSNVTVAGNTKIGKHCYIGSGSSIINNISIANNTLIGMGSNVIKTFEQPGKIVGNPGRML
jgi:sugar O-acyltransferase (sialic acid O-acetyltransferase NeuD family)